MHAMKGLEFQAVAVVGVERGLVPEPATHHTGNRGSGRVRPRPAARALRPVRGVHPGQRPSLRIGHRPAEHLPAGPSVGPAPIRRGRRRAGWPGRGPRLSAESQHEGTALVARGLVAATAQVRVPHRGNGSSP
jgi:hypothetical protein